MAAGNNEDTSKELNKIMDSCRPLDKRASSVPLNNVVKSGEEVKVENRLSALAPKVVEDRLKEKNLVKSSLKTNSYSYLCIRIN